jgi:anti-sigma B factor antagonist
MDPEPVGDGPTATFPAPVEVGPGRWRFEPAGEIDMANAGSLTAACADLIERRDVTLELDLAEVSYLDSSGIGAVVSVLRAIESRGGTVHITNPSGIVARVLELSGLLPLLGDQPS